MADDVVGPMPANLNFRVVGGGRPNLVFVHGFGCSLDDWDATIFELSDRFACVAVDLPGHGLSKPLEENSITTFAKEVNAVVDSLGLNDVVFVGHSLGTKVIRECYRQSKQAVAGLAFVDGSIYVGDPEIQIAELNGDLARDGIRGFVNRSFQAMFPAKVERSIVDRVVERASGIDAELGAQILIDSIRWEAAVGNSTWSSVRVPILLIQSTQFQAGFGRTFMTPTTETPLMRKLSSLSTAVDIKVMSDTGHFPMIESPETVANYLADFARSAVQAARTGPSQR
ncbi:MAG: alpha/beta hydrolase [Magnetospirillum sp.]|nr:alpha/beta hydrolase [Magnetospirillum sp.]